MSNVTNQVRHYTYLYRLMLDDKLGRIKINTYAFLSLKNTLCFDDTLNIRKTIKNTIEQEVAE